MKELADPAGQLAYLEKTLATYAALEDYKVWIVGNMNPGSRNCNGKWARRYNSIVQRW